LPEMRIYPELCKGVEECRLCMEVCPQKLFSPSESLNRKGYRPPQVTQIDLCTQCQNCMIYCPDLAIAVEPKKRGTDKGSMKNGETHETTEVTEKNSVSAKRADKKAGRAGSEK
jgi:2-oxoglutarate ferredoxin oxidoreductase subunit delta